MRSHRRWTAGLLAALMAAASISSGLAAQPFADFRIGAGTMDTPERTISVDIYRRDDSGQFQVSTNVEYTCKLNRVTDDASFYILPKEDGVWASVDYLTDLNGDGTYELLDGGDQPVWDVLAPNGTLVSAQTGPAPELPGDQTHILAPRTLVRQSQAATAARRAGGAYALGLEQDTAVGQSFPLCMVKLHCGDDVQTYYLQLYDDVLMPFDVAADAPYYDAVEFVLKRGYLGGIGNGLFAPDAQLVRAQLAQILWNINGSPAVEPADLSDVPADAWFRDAVSWSQQTGLLCGYTEDIFAPDDPLVRAQLFTVLYRYAGYAGASLRATASLSRFSDGDTVPDWAETAVRWAVTHRLIPGDTDTLDLNKTVTRAELAQFLYAYEQNLKFK